MERSHGAARNPGVRAAVVLQADQGGPNLTKPYAVRPRSSFRRFGALLSWRPASAWSRHAGYIEFLP